MPEQFQRNDRAFVKKLIDEETHQPKIGVVERVYEHLAPDDDGNFEADVVVDNGSRREERCPIVDAGTGQTNVPRVGDKVLVIYTENQSNKPVITGVLWTNRDRPPLGRAGLTRNEFESRQTAASTGNVYSNGYTKYNQDSEEQEPADVSKYNLQPDRVSIQPIAKHDDNENVTPTTRNNIPVKFEYYESPPDQEDEAYLVARFTHEDGDPADANWGFKFNIKAGTWQIVGPNGFGIESDGQGNFTWHHKSIDFNEVSAADGPLSL